MTEHRITVLGAGGFIGSHLSSYLKAKNITHRAPRRDDLSWLQEPLGDVIYAIGLTADFRSRPLETVEAHVGLLHDLLEKGDFRSLTYLSSTRVYSGNNVTSENARLKVNPTDPSDLYNLSKLMGESLALHCGRPFMKIARLSNVIGLRSDPDIFIDQLLEEGFRSAQIKLRTSLESKKDYVSIDDVVELLVRIARSDAEGVFNVASGEAVSNRQVLAAIEKEFGFTVTVAQDAPIWEFEPVDITKTKQIFGFEPKQFERYFPQFLSNYHRNKRKIKI